MYFNVIYIRSEAITAVTMKNFVFQDLKNRVRTLQETRYISATKPKRLKSCKFGVFTAATVKDVVLCLQGDKNR
jgi:hypothetical protein